MTAIKEILVNQLESILDKRIETANRDIELAKESRDNVGLGKLNIDNKIYFAISLASPFGKILINKKVGDDVDFQSKKIIITEIL